MKVGTLNILSTVLYTLAAYIFIKENKYKICITNLCISREENENGCKKIFNAHAIHKTDNNLPTYQL